MVGSDAAEKRAPAQEQRCAASKRGGEAHALAAGEIPSKEIGGAPGPEPTRYGDWEHNGRCTDF